MCAQVALQDYVENKTDPGGFLMAVLRNDLRSACEVADDINRYKLFDYVSYIYNKLPSDCWGSKEAVDAWLER